MKKYKIIIFVICCSYISGCRFLHNEGGDQKSNILIVADEWPQMHTLAYNLKQTGKYNIDSVHMENLHADIKQYDCVFMYIHSILSKDSEQSLINYTNNGGRLIVLHHGIASAKLNNPDWLEFVGIRLYSPDDEKYGWKVLHDTTLTMVNLAPEHFITTNNIMYNKIVFFNSLNTDSISCKCLAFDLTDTEIFLNQIFTDSKNKKLLFGFSTEDGSTMQPTAAWYQKKGSGLLFYFQAGHSITDFKNENFNQILLNTLQWKP